MADDQAREAGEGPRVWKGTIEHGEELASHQLVALTEEDLHFVTYDTKPPQQKAALAIKQGTDPFKAIGRDGQAITLSDIVRVEKQPGEDCVNVQFGSDADELEWAKVACPDEVADKVFQALRKRLAPRLRLSRAGGSVSRAIMTPSAILIVLWVIAGIFLLGVVSREPAPGQFESSRSAGLRRIATFLGTRNILLIAVGISAGLCVWGGIAIAVMPNKKVLEEADKPKRKKKSARAEDEEDEEDRPRPRRKQARTEDDADEEDRPRPKSKPAVRRQAAVDDDEEENRQKPAPRKLRKRADD
jgi:hypothetical protein